METFELNMGDAHWLIRTAEVLSNQRTRRMRSELRDKVGEALGIRSRDRKRLDCIESDEVFVVIKPSASVTRAHVRDLSPLLRQAVVAGCAAVETYLADTVMEHIMVVVRDADPIPKRLEAITLDVPTWIDIEDLYTHRRRGLRELVIKPRIREMSSTAPSQVGLLLSMLGVDGPMAKINRLRRAPTGNSQEDLERITDRRNRIAHEGDRQGRGRATITIEEARNDLAILESIVHAIQPAVEEAMARFDQDQPAVP